MVGETHMQAEDHQRQAAGGRLSARRPRASAWGSDRPRRLPRAPLRAGHTLSAFTLTELMVSVGILLILLSMVGTIFSMASKASSTATANSEIMGNLRTVEQQLTHDFASLRRDAFIGLWYQLTPDPTDTSANPRALRTDRIVFFSNEAHYSVQALRDTVTGQIVNALTANPADPLGPWNARIFYGHAASIIPAAVPTERDSARWALGRRAKLLAPDIDLSQLSALPTNPEQYDFYDFETERWSNAWMRPLTIVDWQNQAMFPIESYFELAQGGLMVDDPAITRSWDRRPIVDAGNNRGPHMLLLPGCAEFKIQRWTEFDPRTGSSIDWRTGTAVPWIPRWWPEADLDGDGVANENAADSDFVYAGTWVAGYTDQVNVREYFNGPPPWTAQDPSKVGWAAGTAGTPYYAGTQGPWFYSEPAYMPKAIKLTIRLHDANKRLDEGRQLTMVFPLQ